MCYTTTESPIETAYFDGEFDTMTDAELIEKAGHDLKHDIFINLACDLTREQIEDILHGSKKEKLKVLKMLVDKTLADTAEHMRNEP